MNILNPKPSIFSMKPWTHDLDSPWCCQMHGSNMLQTDAQRRHPKGPLFKGMLSPKKEGPYFSGIWWKDVRSYLQGWAPKCLHVCHVCIICWWSHYFHYFPNMGMCFFMFFCTALNGGASWTTVKTALEGGLFRGFVPVGHPRYPGVTFRRCTPSLSRKPQSSYELHQIPFWLCLQGGPRAPVASTGP